MWWDDTVESLIKNKRKLWMALQIGGSKKRSGRKIQSTGKQK